MPDRVTIVIPTLSADRRLTECLDALDKQTRRDFEVVIVDNSGAGRVRSGEAGQRGAKIIEPARNVGFGAAINLAFHQTQTPYLAALNDDAAPRPGWLASLLAAAEAHPDAGMFASQVRFFGEEHLDSAGMVIARDGSSKQRGHLFPAAEFDREEEVLFPSASAALYRRAMLDTSGSSTRIFFCIARIPISVSSALGGMEMRVHARGCGGPSLFALGRPGITPQGLLRGAQSPVCSGEELSCADVVGGSLCHAGALLVALAVDGAGTRYRSAVSPRGESSVAASNDCDSRALGPGAPRWLALAEEP